MVVVDGGKSFDQAGVWRVWFYLDSAEGLGEKLIRRVGEEAMMGSVDVYILDGMEEEERNGDEVVVIPLDDRSSGEDERNGEDDGEGNGCYRSLDWCVCVCVFKSKRREEEGGNGHISYREICITFSY